MIFKPMKKADVLRALEGHKDIITPAAKAEIKYIRSLPCPSCGGELQEHVNARTPFRANSVVPNFLGKCVSCGAEFEPYSGIQVTMPTER